MDQGSIPLPRRRLADIDKKFTSQSGLHDTSELETSRGSIRIQHLTCGALQPSVAQESGPRFPRLEECAHFHYDHVDLDPFTIEIHDDSGKLQSLVASTSDDSVLEKFWIIQVCSKSKTWHVRRTLENFCSLDEQLHRCIYDRNFSCLPELKTELEHSNEDLLRPLLTEYLTRLSQINGPLINCAPVLNWFELDNRGHRLVATDDSDINTPAVAAAYAVRRYQALAADEISFEVGDMISVIDMPPPEESAWWRGKRGFDVGFFPFECVQVIGEKVPTGLQFPPPAPMSGCPNATVRRTSSQLPNKPVLRKHGKLISFFRSFILSRPARRKLKQSGILKERVFGCDLGEHLLNSGHDIPLVLRVCADYIESHGIVDGIYRLSGVSSNIQKLRIAFDEDRAPLFQNDDQISQDIHAVSSLLKMYFRELPNPLCTYQLYDKFVEAVQQEEDEARLLQMREVVLQLPPPHYRTLEYLMRHLSHVAENGAFTGMTAKNLAIVWAPNLLRCKELEAGGVAALQGVGIQAVVTEYLVRYVHVIFSNEPPADVDIINGTDSRRLRPKSLAISAPGKLLSLEEARNRAQLATGKADQKFIEVGGGPATLPKYHTVIELPNKRGSSLKQKKSPSGWKSFFSKSRGNSSSGTREDQETTTPKGHARTLSSVSAGPTVHVSRKDQAPLSRQGSLPRRKLRPVKSAESLVSGSNSSRNSQCIESPPITSPQAGDLIIASPVIQENEESPVLENARTHNRSASHDSYFNVLVGPIEICQEPLNEVDESFVLSDMQLDSTLNLDNSDMNMMCSEEMMPDKSQDELCVASDPKRSKVDDEMLSAHVASAVNRVVSQSGLQCAFNPVYEISDKKSGHSTPENTDAQVGDIVSEAIDRSDSLENVSIHEPTEQETGLTTSECSISLPMTLDQSLTIHSRPQIAVNIDYENMLSSVDISVPYESIVESAPPSYTAVIQDELYENVLYSTQGPEVYENSGYEPFERQTPDYEKLEQSYEALVKEEVRYEVLQREEPYEPLGTETSDTYENVQSAYENVDNMNVIEPQQEYENVQDVVEPASYENVKPEPAPRNSIIREVSYENVGENVTAAELEEEVAYENILKEAELKAIISSATDTNLYEDVSVADLPLMPSPPSSILSEEAVYQQVKVLKRSIEEVNEIIREPVADRLSPEKSVEAIIPEVKKPDANTPSSDVATDSPLSVASEPITPVTSVVTQMPARVLSASLDCPVPWRAKKSKTDGSPKNVPLFPNFSSERVPEIAKEFPAPERPKKLEIFKPLEESAPALPISASPKRSSMPEKVDTPTKVSTPVSSEPIEKTTPKVTDISPKRPTVLSLKSSPESKPPVLLRSQTSLDKVQTRRLGESPAVSSTRSSLSLALESPTIESRTRSKTDSDPSLQSPTRRLSFLETGESKRRVESEIGRDLIHARKLREEMETRRHESTPTSDSKENINPKIDPRKVDGIVSARPALVTPVNNRFEKKVDKKASVKDLLNRFESKEQEADQKTKSLEGISAFQEVITDKHEEPARPKSAPGDDESHLLVANEPLSLTELSDRLIDPKVLVDINDPVTRQRIEKYKEERRSQLREKFKSESFRGEKDEMLIRLKQKAGSPTRIEDTTVDTDSSPKISRLNRRNSSKSELTATLSSSPESVQTLNNHNISRVGSPPRVPSDNVGDEINVKELVANWTKGGEVKVKKEEDKKLSWKKEEKKSSAQCCIPHSQVANGEGY